MLVNHVTHHKNVNVRLGFVKLRNEPSSLHRPDRVAQLAEHWAGIPKVVGSIPTVARHIFQACPVWIYHSE